MKPFDDYEISGCRYDHHHDIVRVDDDDEDGPQFWTLYGLRDGMAEEIADLPTREAAERLYSSITGKQFPLSRRFGTRASDGALPQEQDAPASLKLRHDRLLAALQSMIWRFEGIEDETGEPDETLEEARVVVARVSSEAPNVRRMSAAWNGCQGIPTEALEHGIVAELVDTLDEFFNIMHDYECSARKGYVQGSLQRSKAVLDRARGRAA